MDNISSAPFLSGYTYRSIANQAICDIGDTEHMKDVSHLGPQEGCDAEGRQGWQPRSGVQGSESRAEG